MNNINGLKRNGILMLAFLFAFSVSTFAAPGSVDFSGTWALNTAKTPAAEGGFGPAKSLKVTQSGNDLSVETVRAGRDGQEMTITNKYTLDGKPCVNTSMRGEATSVLTWSADGKSLTITTTSSFSRNGQTTEMKSVDVWTLSADGKTLTIDQTSSTPRGERKTTAVYDKK
jgi:hypothetical protein